MKLFLTINFIFGTVLFLAPSWGGDNKKIGELAKFQLVKGARTSSIVRSGKATTEIVDYLKAGDEGEFHIQLDYAVKVMLLGRKTGSHLEILPEKFFTPEFFVELREKKEMDTGRVKIKHLGFVDVTTASGESYPNCDRIKFYDYQKDEDIDTKGWGSLLNWSENEFQAIAPSLKPSPYFGALGTVKKPQAERRTTVYASIFLGAPVMGAVQIDVLHERSGLSFILGFDMLPNR